VEIERPRFALPQGSTEAGTAVSLVFFYCFITVSLESSPANGPFGGCCWLAGGKGSAEGWITAPQIRADKTKRFHRNCPADGMRMGRTITLSTWTAWILAYIPGLAHVRSCRVTGKLLKKPVHRAFVSADMINQLTRWSLSLSSCRTVTRSAGSPVDKRLTETCDLRVAVKAREKSSGPLCIKPVEWRRSACSAG
jgi:hypothetical protein